MFETPDDVLEHFGVKGMQWGVRKVRSVGRSAKKTKDFAREHPRTTKLAVAATAALGAAAAGRVLGNSGNRRLMTVALPGATGTLRDGSNVSFYGSGPMRLTQVRMRDLPALNSRYGLIRP